MSLIPDCCGGEGGSGTPTTPGGADTEVQFNDAGTFGGDPNLTWDKVDGVLTIGGGPSAALELGAGAAVRSGPSGGDTALLQAYDTNVGGYRTFGTLTSNLTPSLVLAPPGAGTLNVTATNLHASGLAYPTADGSPNQVMFTDGAGTLGFMTISAGAGDDAQAFFMG